ncbi:hypothetical protein [Streptomyces sp. NRRL WC-3742]|uniref:hypothetical protein n=1 Tax=Streptomyces sp. NRRL WC-3742 TaxID=1463934 RepID=UPI0004CB736E|nr:hypothetical protein [Streptomyces sp. NRRL WC-3742]
MGRRLIAPPTRKSRLIVLLAVLSCAPAIIKLHTSTNPPDGLVMIIEALVVTLTALPLIAYDQSGFRAGTMTSGWLIFGAQLLLSAFWVFILLIPFVVFLPAGLLLLIAARRDAPVARLTIAVVLGALPYAWLLGFDFFLD